MNSTVPFVRLFSQEDFAVVLNAFLRRPGVGMSYERIQNVAQEDIDCESVRTNVEQLINLGMVEEKDNGYYLDMDDELVKHLGRTHRILVERSQAIPNSTDDLV